MALTNTLINRIHEIKTAGESYNNSNVLKDKKREIESFLTSFNEVCKKFDDVSGAYASLIVVCNDIIVDFKSIHSNITQLKAKITHDEYDKLLTSALKRELDKINTELLRSWKAYIKNKTASIDGVLETLGNLISETTEKQILQNKKNIFTVASIGSPAAIKAIEDYIETYNTLMGKLNLSENVLAFLKLLTSGRTVTLNDMSAEVYEWIKTSGFAGKINIGIGLGR